MKESRFGKVFGGPGKIQDPASPEILFLYALAAGDEERVLALFDEEKQFGGKSAVDCPHGRFEGKERIREFVRTWYSYFHAEKGEVEIVTQIRSAWRVAVEFVFHFPKDGGEELQIPMALAADLRGDSRRLDEVRTYMCVTWIDDYPKYRKPIFPEQKTHETRNEMLSGVMPYYMNLVTTGGMFRIPELMTDKEPLIFGAYGPTDEIVVTTKEQHRLDEEEAREKRIALHGFDTQGFPLEKYVKLRMETIIDDGKICCVEWEQLVTKAGREERNRLSEPGISFYERAKDGYLKSYRIIDYAYTEGMIDWSKAPITKEEAEAINYLG